MHCPNCGTPALAEQKFCRSCGLGLQTVSEIVAAHRPGEKSDEPLAEPIHRDQARQIKMWKRMWAGGFALMFIGIILSLVGRKIVQDEIIVAIGAVISILGFWPLLYPFFSMFQAEEPARAGTARPTVTPTPAANQWPEAHLQPAVSITEETTGLLEVGVAEAVKGGLKEAREPHRVESPAKAETTNPLDP